MESVQVVTGLAYYQMKSHKICNKFAIGTAQFGFVYGIANKLGQVRAEEARDILACAKKAGINMLDTAIGYGNCESVLGNIGISGWEVISKLPAIPVDCLDIKKWVYDTVHETLSRLNTSKISGLLLHKPEQLIKENGSIIYDALVTLKADNLVDKIGVSIYDPYELDAICSNYQFDVVQAPLNIIDRRLVNSGRLCNLVEQGIEVHVRSVFMQGLLLMRPDSRPSIYNRWQALWEFWQDWLEQSEITPLEACLAYVLNQQGIDRIIIGVDSLSQFEEVLQAATSKITDFPQELQCEDIELINPTLWGSIQ